LQVGIGEASTGREVQASRSCEEVHEGHHHHHQQQQQQNQHAQQQISSTAFHISRPSHPISTIISPPPLHHASIILDDNSYHVSRIMLQNENFQVIITQQPTLLQDHFWLLIIFSSVISPSAFPICKYSLYYLVYRF